MKVIIDLIEDIEQSIQNDGSFIMGAICIDSNSESEMVALWGKAIVRCEVDDEKGCFNFFVGELNENRAPLSVQTFLDATKEFTNKELMYEVFVSTQENQQEATAALVGFSEVVESKQYRLLLLS